MKAWLLTLLLTFLMAGAASAEEVSHGTGEHGFPAGHHDATTHPEAGEGAAGYADDDRAGPKENFGPPPIPDNELFAVFKADRFEYQSREGPFCSGTSRVGSAGTTTRSSLKAKATTPSTTGRSPKPMSNFSTAAPLPVSGICGPACATIS